MPGRVVWYSGAMIPKGMLAYAVLAVAVQATPAHSQARRPAATPATAAVSSAAAAAKQSPAAPVASPSASTAASSVAPGDCFGGNCDLPAPHISIATPAPAPAPWTWQQRVAWGANLVLVVLGYIAILLALPLLRKIERQTRAAEETAQAAADAARAALRQAEAVERAERPWIVMSVRPAHDAENAFTVVAANRGHSPASIVSMIDEAVIAIDEDHLDPAPAFQGEPKAPPSTILLLPGESTDIASIRRDQVEQISGSAEQFRRIEDWEEKLYLYGKVAYRDLIKREDKRIYESSWCAWYIHGRQKSGMVMAGPPVYNRHT